VEFGFIILGPGPACLEQTTSLRLALREKWWNNYRITGKLQNLTPIFYEGQNESARGSSFGLCRQRVVHLRIRHPEHGDYQPDSRQPRQVPSDKDQDFAPSGDARDNDTGLLLRKLKRRRQVTQKLLAETIQPGLRLFVRVQ
jgi:hypothetical protein